MANIESEGPTGSARRAVYWCVLAVIPILLLAAAEGALRIVGYGSAYRLFHAVPGHSEYKSPNAGVGGLYFSERPPSVLADYYRSEADSGDIRIFVQGGSTAAGYPYYYGGSFPQILENVLRRILPDQRVDVVNTSMAAVNSYTLLDLAPQIADENPDAVLIYAGHNEYFGALGVSSTERVPGGRTLVLAYLRLMRLRLAQLLRVGTDAIGGIRGNGIEAEAGRMEALARDRAIPFGSATYLEGLEQFRLNLKHLIAFYRARDIPVFISTVASNVRDQAPFVSGLSPGTDPRIWNRQMRAVPESTASAGVLAALRRLVEQDSASAEVRYRLAQVLENRGHVSDARREYLRAKDLDQLRFRAPEAINAIVRELTSAHGATLVDAQARLLAASRNGLIGSDVMVDHVHPSPAGYGIIADAFAEALFRSGVLDGRNPKAHPSLFVSPENDGTETIQPDPQAESVLSWVLAEDMLLTEVDSLVGTYHVEELKSRWPFTLIGERGGRSTRGETAADRSADESESVDQAIEALAKALFQGEVTWEQANRALFAHQVRRGEYERALRTARSRMQEFPFLAEPYLMAAAVHVRLGSTERALDLLKTANTLSETAAAHRMLARTYALVGDAVRSDQHTARALELRSARP